METLGRLCFLAAAVVVCCTSSVETRARSVSDTWLALVDRGDHDEAWQLTAMPVRLKVGRQRWEATVRDARNHGAVQSRKFLDVGFDTEPFKMPPGDYIVVRYETEFANENAVEVVVLVSDSSGAWKVAAYFVSTRADGRR